MRETINFNADWLFHKGDICDEYPPYKGIAYISAKTARKYIGPAAKSYLASDDSFDTSAEHKSEAWRKVSLPHDYVIEGEIIKDANPALGFFAYDNAWYIKNSCSTNRTRIRE